MNRLQSEDRVRILSALAEGMGVNAACRITGASKNTVLKLLADVGRACALYQDQTMRGLKITQVQCDEIWSFVGMKDKNVPVDADPALRLGDAYTFTAIDPVTKLMPCWLVGGSACAMRRAPMPSSKTWPAGSRTAFNCPPMVGSLTRPLSSATSV